MDYSNSWILNKIDEICLFVRDGTHGSFKDDDNGIPLLSAKDISDGKIHVYEDSRRISISDYNTIHKKYELEIGDILLTIVGTIGRTAMVDNSIKFTLQRSVAILRTNNEVSNNFIYYYIQSPTFQKRLKSMVNQSAQGGVYLNSLKKLKISIPNDLDEQNKISYFLMQIDKKIELLENKYQKYVDFKKYLMQQIFAQNLRFDFNDDWNVDMIGNNCEVFGRIGFRGYTVDDLVNKGEGALTIGGKHISKDYKLDLTSPEYLSLEKYEESPEIKIYNGDVLLVKTASVGKVCFIENLNEKATINPQLVVFKNIKLNNKFFYYYLTSNLFQKDIHKIKSTTGIPTITQKELLNLNILYPSLEEQEIIVNLMSSVDKKISFIDKSLKDIEQFKRGLLQQMFV